VKSNVGNEVKSSATRFRPGAKPKYAAGAGCGTAVGGASRRWQGRCRRRDRRRAIAFSSPPALRQEIELPRERDRSGPRSSAVYRPALTHLSARRDSELYHDRSLHAAVARPAIDNCTEIVVPAWSAVNSTACVLTLRNLEAGFCRWRISRPGSPFSCRTLDPDILPAQSRAPPVRGVTISGRASLFHMNSSRWRENRDFFGA